MRPYQNDAVLATLRSLYSNDRVLVSMPCGTGKTIVGSYLVGAWPVSCEAYQRNNRVLWLAHRGELLWQAADAIKREAERRGLPAGRMPQIEKADEHASSGPWSLAKAEVVVGSVQTLMSEERRAAYAPDDFGLVVLDEGHHAVAEGFLEVLNYFSSAKLVSMTATTDRSDEVSLGKIFEDVPYHYELLDAIRDGWCAPILQQYVEVEGLDWSGVTKNAAGDARVIQEESALHHIAAPAAEMMGDRQTIVFAPSIAVGEALATVFERYVKGRVAFVSGKTPIEERGSLLDQYICGGIQVIVNCMLLTEGWDAPRTSCIVVARPTQSRMLYAQMLGRGSRGGVKAPVEGKENALVIDLVGASLKHKLVHAADVLGGKYDEVVVEHANQRLRDEAADGEGADVIAELMAAAELRDELKRRQRMQILAKAKAKRTTVDPFGVLDMPERRLPGWWDAKPPTEQQLKTLEANGVKTAGLDRTAASQLVGEVIRRRAAGECNFKQARRLASYGYDQHVTFEVAGKILDGIAERKWKHTKWEMIAVAKRKRGHGV